MELVKFESLGGSSVIATTSLRIAEFTGKEHYNVIRDIETLVKSGELGALNFELSNYKTSQGKLMPLYLLDETFTTILLMGFTGKEAMKGNLNPSNVSKTLGTKYLEEVKKKTILIKDRG